MDRSQRKQSEIVERFRRKIQRVKGGGRFQLPSQLLLIIIGFFLAFPVYAVGGLTGNYAILTSPDALEPGNVESTIELTLFHAHSRYNEYGHKKNIPGDYDRLHPGESTHTISESGLAFTFSAGVLDGLEAGFSFGHTTNERGDGGLSFTSFDEFRTGLKYSLPEQGPFRFAAIGGLNMETVRWTLSGEAGGAMSVEPLPGWTIESNLVYFQSMRRTIDSEPAVEHGSRAGAGSGYQMGIFRPGLELSYIENHHRHLRAFTAGRWIEVNGNLSPEQAEINVLSQMGVPDTMLPESIPVFGGWPVPPPELKESVLVFERKLSVTASLTLDINEKVSFIFFFTQDLTGVGAPAGQTFSGIVTYAF